MRNCPLCDCPLEIHVDRDDGTSVAFQFSNHTVHSCREMTLHKFQWFREQLATIMQREHAHQIAIHELSRWIGIMSDVCRAGADWLREHKAAPDRESPHPLFMAEGELAAVLRRAIDLASPGKAGR